MMLGRFSRVMERMLGMPVRYVGVMASLFVTPAFVMLRSFTMVFRRVLVMFGRLVVVFRTFVCRHLVVIRLSRVVKLDPIWVDIL
jgi:hypothetical protein